MSKFVLVYVDTEERICESFTHEVFDTKEKAQRAMQKQVKKSFGDVEEEDWEEVGYEGIEDAIEEDSAFVPEEVAGEGDYFWKIIEVEV